MASSVCNFCYVLCYFVLFLNLGWSHSSQQVLQGHESTLLPPDNSIQLNFTSPAPHIFLSVHSLLQQWTNTFFTNGHSIVPCEISPYTLLYHGRPTSDLPLSPEFLAFDIEMAYAIMGSARDSHMITYQTTRSIKCIYFDGQSAALMGHGAMDTQMVFLFGNTTGPESHGRGFLADEYLRARELCKWLHLKGFGGPGWGYEGIIRMNAGFEMIWCNFSSPSLRMISHLNVTAPLLPRETGRSSSGGQKPQEAVQNPTPLFPLPTVTAPDSAPTASNPPGFDLPYSWRDLLLREPFLYAAGWEWFRSTTWQYGSSGAGIHKGETRIKLAICGFLSYYNPKFGTRATAMAEFESKYLNLTNDGVWKGPGGNGTYAEALNSLERRRRHHSIRTIDPSEATFMKEDAELALANLLDPIPVCSDMDWTRLTDEIVQRYSNPLSELSSFLKSFNDTISTSESGIKNMTLVRMFMAAFRVRTHAFLLPFLEYPNTEIPEDSLNYSEWLNKTWSLHSSHGQRTLSHCQNRYTRLLAPDQHLTLNPGETLILDAVTEVMSAICSTVVDVGFGVEHIWFEHFNRISEPSSAPSTNKSNDLPDLSFLPSLTSAWSQAISLLLAYLSWKPLLTTCSKTCAFDETCHIPMWPLQPMFAPVEPSHPSNSTRPPWYRPGRYGRNETYPPYGYHPSHGYYPPNHGPPLGGRNRSQGYGGMDNLPPGQTGFWWLDYEDGLWEPRCVKVQDMNRGLL